ncbi:hypothetical protein [Lactobacillus sp. Sy-1]|uniref:hypothetical protein n=1 Tax=Lactobacillus sp. Sy-1 TaxID=2109645 RepID=UPI001C5B3EDE|nr:hypothetical protein [Lactobacillus sp. Sy-1]MBW1606131.1 hypothetical protein [Lactobacillus sp. Sy-1]
MAVGGIDVLIIIGIITSLIVTDGDYFWGIVSLTVTYGIMVLAASAAQFHNKNGVFKDSKVGFVNGFIFNLFFLLIKPI